MAVQTASPGKGLQIRWHWWWLLIGLLAVIVLGILAFAIFKPVKVLPRLRLAPGFILVDQDGQRLTNEDLLGKVVVYNFLYTGCGEACDAMNDTMRTVQARLGEVNPGIMPVQFVTISFDPEHDTPDKLKAYALAQGADPAQWRFATGDPARMKQIIGDGFEAYYAPDGHGSFQFDPTFVLVDGWGIIRGEYRYQVETPDAERILRHIGVLAEEVQKSKGANKLIYEAAHLFLCYSP